MPLYALETVTETQRKRQGMAGLAWLASGLTCLTGLVSGSSVSDGGQGQDGLPETLGEEGRTPAHGTWSGGGERHYMT